MTYGFKVNKGLIKDYKLDSYSKDFTVKCLETRDKQFVILQSIKSRIKDLVIEMDNENNEISRLLIRDNFVSIFLIFDIDHNTAHEIDSAFNRFKDASEGLLILSSPCFEAIVPYSKKSNYISHSFKEYKQIKKEYCTKNYHISVEDYIKYNFNELLIHHLKK